MSFNEKKRIMIFTSKIKGARSGVNEGITLRAEEIEKRRDVNEELAEDLEDGDIIQKERITDVTGYKSSSLIEEQGVKMQNIQNISESNTINMNCSTGGYAEMFETLNGASIDCGYFVTLDGRRIRKVMTRDKFILGVTTITPGVTGNGQDIRWKNKYLTDEWGRIKYEDVLIPSVKDQYGNELCSERTERRPMINPKWDKDKQYIPRALRNEWVYVSLLGQVPVRDDGSCKVNGYCVPNSNAVATTSSRGYRVIERLSSNQVVILLRATIVSNNNRN
ncbi:peptidase G2 autoproteolytic cleavage domain-containing protein [Clostridium oryzae]|uniref:Peptidase G2 IMC autoproteolytic cleavage domain-containing protein n=1 Tax=Clostridium oryzae TaxID=1450648 RepID=A0A1V4IYM0_9CLOT|nr:peptidase G2 autoproteolytic cleavage domain-containing protein [Clostridium oryzae]OPJ65036.1 hypothetical protein CLORY_00360 [Clostridium oryzae]